MTDRQIVTYNCWFICASCIHHQSSAFVILKPICHINFSEYMYVEQNLTQHTSSVVMLGLCSIQCDLDPVESNEATHRVALDKNLPSLSLKSTQHSSKVLPAHMLYRHKEEDKQTLETSLNHVPFHLHPKQPPDDPGRVPTQE